MNTILSYLNRTPPLAVRAAAIQHIRGGPDGDRVKRIPLRVLLKASGVPRRTFQRLSYKLDWTGVPVDVASAFCAACGVNLLAKQPLYQFFRAHKLKKLNFLTTRQRLAMDKAVKRFEKPQ